MKERPILFSAPMVRALLAGTKTQTRRVCKPQPIADERFSGGHCLPPTKRTEGASISVEAPYVGNACPYGARGDRLWVRETFRGCRAYEVHGYAPKDWGNKPLWFEADGQPLGKPEAWAQRARPSIHMPRWASRILLEITDVRVERLQDISEGNAEAEGVGAKHAADVHYTAREAYAVLWEQINGGGAWDANPWVWAVSFKVITPPAIEGSAPSSDQPPTPMPGSTQ